MNQAKRNEMRQLLNAVRDALGESPDEIMAQLESAQHYVSRAEYVRSAQIAVYIHERCRDNDRARCACLEYIAAATAVTGVTVAGFEDAGDRATALRETLTEHQQADQQPSPEPRHETGTQPFHGESGGAGGEINLDDRTKRWLIDFADANDIEIDRAGNKAPILETVRDAVSADAGRAWTLPTD